MSTTHRSTPAQTALVRVEDPGSDGLKAERIQGAVPFGDLKLKAERIQIVFRDLPGWRLERGGRIIARTFELGSVREIARFLQYVAELGHAGDLLPDVIVQAGRVTVALPTVGGGSWIEPHHFALAQAFEVTG
jgi:pterin-4a-carbinolamine dehydratase